MKNILIDFLLKILALDSTTGKESGLVDYIVENFEPDGAEIEIQQISSGQKNLFFKWGNPRIIFCTHLDTVPPYIPPHIEGEVICGRGSCDAKGQIAVMYETCKQLHKEKQTDFGLLLLAGEEKDCCGAKVANKTITGCQYVIVGEPTKNKIITAAKGVLLAEVIVSGKASHSAYPEKGDNAIERFRLFLNKLTGVRFPLDRILGETTYNVGLLRSLNACNTISDKVECNILFRTTFSTHDLIREKIEKMSSKNIRLHIVNSMMPINFFTVGGFESSVVAFGSDAHILNKLGKRILYGPGDILVAHTKHEHIKASELEIAIENLKLLYYKLIS